MSSGNLAADRRFAYALSLRGEDIAAACDLMMQALEEAPRWPEGVFTMAELLAEAGQSADAIATYRRYLALDPADSMGGHARLALLGAENIQELPAAYVTRLFDQYAPRFDTALTDKLHYRAPELLRAAVLAVGPRFPRVYDLGCGTGLAGVAMRDLAGWLGGVDLSPAMIREAARKQIYDDLRCTDLLTALRELDQPCDLMIAADVLVYCGDLAPIFAAVREKLAPGGHFAFTLQRAKDRDVEFGSEQRFSHSRAYVQACAREARLAVASLEDAVCRQEKGIDASGLVVILRPA